MTFRGKLLVAACALIPTLIACGPTDAQPVDLPGDQSAALYSFPEVCPVTDRNCFPEEPPCDPIYDLGCEPCPRTNPLAWCYEPPCTAADGLINTFTTDTAGLERDKNPEVSWLGGTRCNRMVITGIGARIVSDSNYDMLQIEYRQPYANGTLGPPTVVKTGNLSASYEAWLKAPEGHVIVGMAFGQQGTHDLKTLVIWYRKFELTSAGVRLTGPLSPLSWEGATNGPIDASYINYDSDKVFVGVGLASAVEKTKTIRVQLGKLP